MPRCSPVTGSVLIGVISEEHGRTVVFKQRDAVPGGPGVKT